MSGITIVRDLRGRLGTAREQGPRPTCLAFAASDAHAAVRDATWAELSCEYLFYHALRRQGAGPTSGATMVTIRDALDHDGQPLESGWTYQNSPPNPWRPPADVGTVFRRTSRPLTGRFGRAWCKVISGTPVVIGMSLSDAFYVPNDGVVDVKEPVDPTRRHAVLAVAAGTWVETGKHARKGNRGRDRTRVPPDVRRRAAERAGTRFLMVRNSWGAGWGLVGHAWLAERYLRPRIMEMFTIA